MDEQTGSYLQWNWNQDYEVICFSDFTPAEQEMLTIRQNNPVIISLVQPTKETND